MSTLTSTAVLVQTHADQAAFREWLASGTGDIAIDTETTGLDPSEASFWVTHLALADADGRAWVWAGLDPHGRDALLAAAASGRRLWMHNAAYDVAAIERHYRVALTGVRCTMVATRCARPIERPSAGAYSLKTLRPATEDAKDRLLERWLAQGGDAEPGWLARACATLPTDDPGLVQYIATDAVETARLAVSLREATDTLTRRAMLRDIALDDQWRRASRRGYRVDRDLLLKVQVDVEQARKAGLERYGLDLTSVSDETRAWVARHGIVVTDGEGKPTLSRDHWDTAVVPDDAADAWAAFKNARDVAALALKAGELLRLSEATGRVHPRINVAEASTGRMSIGKPALQNLPRSLRGCLLSDEGMVLVGCDLDRVEPKVTAALTQDAGLIEAVRADVYTELAVSVWGEEARGDEQRRDLAKTTFLATLYGQGVESTARRLGVSLGVAQSIKDGILSAHPQLSTWVTGVRKQARAGGQLHTLWGRPVPVCRADTAYKAVNWLIQGSAADLFKIATLAVSDRLGPGALWLPVHDELVVQVTEDRVEDAKSALLEGMSMEIAGVSISGQPKVLGDRLAKA